jgi:predicted MPP superfamily phosphohydrolase
MDKHARSPVLERFAEEIPKDLPSLLLAHRPSFFHHAEELGFPLVLSGHTHGGQIALPFAGNQNVSRMISDFTRGLFHRGETTMYVSRGLGMAGLPLRLNCPREITHIRLSA